MPSQTAIVVTDASGNHLFSTSAFLEIGDNPGLRYVLSCGQIGALTATLPVEFNRMLPKDGRVHVMRSVNGAPAQREGDSCFLIRQWQYANDYTTITALHANDLMRRRAILYSLLSPNESGNTYALVFNEPADDAIKTKWKENAGASILATDRGWSTVTSAVTTTQQDISAYVSVQANLSAAPVVYKFVYWRNLMDLVLELADTSMLGGTYLTAEIVAPTESTLELRTYTGQRGVDRRFASGSGLLFTEARGNLANAVLTIDATQEITFVQSLGAGPDTSLRYSGYALDTTRMGESPFGRIEMLYDSDNAPNDASLTNDADAGVRGNRPLITASADLQETDQCLRGVHFNFGDLVTVEVQGAQYDMRLDLLDVTLTAGVEQTTAKFQYNG